jgi:hypothetical protein
MVTDQSERKDHGNPDRKRSGSKRLPNRRPPSGIRPQAPATLFAPVAEVRETSTDLVIRVRLQQGALELTVPKRALCEPRLINTHDIPGSNPDATPC